MAVPSTHQCVCVVPVGQLQTAREHEIRVWNNMSPNANVDDRTPLTDPEVWYAFDFCTSLSPTGSAPETHRMRAEWTAGARTAALQQVYKASGGRVPGADFAVRDLEFDPDGDVITPLLASMGLQIIPPEGAP